MELIRIYKTKEALLLEYKGGYYTVQADWDEFVNRQGLFAHALASLTTPLKENTSNFTSPDKLLPPIGSQEIWAAGVTYLRSRAARMEESVDSGGATFYDKVYEAERPELFFKATPQRVSGYGDVVYIRKDSNWNVPEPELTLFICSEGTIEGYTIGNDMSSRSIEGENPLYLPQAKVYEKSAGLGPCLVVTDQPLPPETRISMSIFRDDAAQYADSVPISQMKRSHTELVEYLRRGCDFPTGCYLMTGTCLVPDNNFTLKDDDRVEISIDHIGRLVNYVKTYRRD